MPRELPKAYNPTEIEDKWAEFWVDQNLFAVPTPQPDEPSRPPFTMLLPPPNVTGRLHIGHMLNQTEMDILTRWHRMRGDRALWVPGTDHAGIATQMMVERRLTAEGTSRHALGREAFVERVWEWKREYGGAILAQMKRLGASVDWSREYFTMDERLTKAVREAFVRLYEEGLIYRGDYIVNWCPGCLTAISDLEVEHEEQQGKLYEIRYPLADGSGSLTIATTRPETMAGDVAVVVNPGDARYRALVGKMLRLPLFGREIPVLADEWADPAFGTGAVKVTPAHDANDYAIGQRHSLPSLKVMDEHARMNDAAVPYAGLDRFAARKRIVADLEAQGFLVAARDHTNAVGKCSRCKSVVEPRLSTQWFIKIQPLADKAIAAVETGAIRFTPDQYRKVYFEWMRNIRDWCVSRQLWWGHRIPAWYCDACGKVLVAREAPSACSACGSAQLRQETDVLDTWFSSGLLPFTVFGWPNQTTDLATFYPTQLLVTAFDILFFWVARMIMLGCHFMQQVPLPDGSPRPLEEAVPFREVYIHALVRDADRQKMSKTKGNVIDPIELTSQYGTDAVRFTLASMASPGTDIAFSEARTEGNRAFANKIWNAARFIFLQMDRARQAGIAAAPPAKETRIDWERQAIEARWIVSRLHRCAETVNRALAAYRFDDAAQAVYQFFWGEFCDWYLEIVKLRLNVAKGESTQAAADALEALLYVFEAALRLLAPFMPFLTEEIWHALYEGATPQKSIALAEYPAGQAMFAADEARMAALQELIVAVRGLRKDRGVEEKQAVALLATPAAAARAVIAGNEEIIQRLARVSEITLQDAPIAAGEGRALVGFDIGIVARIQVDAVAERQRLTRELEKLRTEMAGKQTQLSNEAFLAKAPPKVVAGLRARADELTVLIEKNAAALEALAEPRK